MLRIAVLGSVELCDGDRKLPVLPPMPRALLSLLALRPGSLVRADEVIDALWGDVPPDSARNIVQVYMSSLRRTLGRDVITSGAGGYGLNAAVPVDAAEFEQGLQEALRGGSDPAVVAGALRSALGLWRGEPLADVAAPFAAGQRTRLTELRLSAVERWADAELACGRHQDELVAELERWVAQHPLREVLWAQLITALDRGGRQADALAAYQRVRSLLRDELGADPGEQLQRAHRDVLARPRSAAPLLPPGAAVPVPRSALVGRESEVAAVRALLARPGVRLVTVLGPGGVGKTRLVLEVARLEAEARRLHSDGVAWVPLAGLTKATNLTAALAHALGAREEPGQDASETLAAALRQRQMVLVLDNLEHLLPQAVPLLAQVLQACTGVVVLVTSRVASRVSGEHRFVLDPLPVHDAEGTAAGSAAAVLLLERADAACPGWAGDPQGRRCAGALAHDLDGLPLALELAAARAALLGPCALRERLRGRLAGLNAAAADAAARHRSLHAAITWSYELLPPPARLVLCQLSVFRGTIGLEAAASVTALDEERLLEQLTILADASLLRPAHDDPPSFRLLETIRAFAAEQLSSDDRETETRARHAEFFLALGESAAPHLWGTQQQEWFDGLEREHDNLRAALQFWLAHGETGLALRLATSLAAFWEAHGHLQEGLDWIGQVLAAAEDADPAVRAQATFSAARLADQRGNAAQSRALLQDSLRLFRLCSDPCGEIFALAHLGLSTAQQGETAAGLSLSAQSVDLARALVDPWYLAMALNNYGYNRVVSGDVGTETGQLLAESLHLRRSLDEKRGIGLTLGSIAELQLLRGDLDGAAATIEEMLALAEALAHAELISIALNMRGFLCAALGNPGRAAAAFRHSFQRSRRMGFRVLAAEALLGLGETAALQGDFRRAMRFELIASQAINAAGQQPSAFQQSAIGRIERHLRRSLDQPAQQAIRMRAQTATLEQALAEVDDLES